MIRLALSLIMILSTTPALADNGMLLSQRERDARIGGCIMTHGTQYEDRCVEIMEGPAAIGRRARQDYQWQRLDRRIGREDRCEDKPGKVSPIDCFFN